MDVDGNIRKRLLANNNGNLKDDSDSSDSDNAPVDPAVLAIYDEPLPMDSEGGFSLPYNRRVLWTSKQVYSALFAFIAGVFIVIFFLSHRELKQLEQQAAIHGTKQSFKASTSWWNTGLIYRVDVRSFYDTNNDGLGDIQGVIEKLEYLKYMKVDAILLSSIYMSAMLDHGRDITDFQAVDHRYGTLKDFEQLVQEVHDKDMKLILELIPNHSSNLHLWFTESRKGGENNKYKDYYIWHRGRVEDDGTLTPPNNWLSRYGNSSWTWDEQRSAYYYHQYLSQMPDLNHRNPGVREEFQSIVEFWLKKGIDGIHFDGVDAIFEVDDLTLDEPLNEDTSVKYNKNHYNYLSHVYTNDQPEIHEYMATWRELIEKYNQDNHKKLCLTVEVSDTDPKVVNSYYTTGADFPLSYSMVNIHSTCGGYCIQEMVDEWNTVPDTNKPVWALSSEWHGRIASRVNEDYARLIAVIQLLLPGAAVIYYGDEISMTHPNLRDHTHHPEDSLLHKRDAASSPMQWFPGRNAGFSKASNLWLPISKDYEEKNVHTLQNDKRPDLNILQLYHKLALLRQEPSFQYGQMQYTLINDNIISFLRFADNEPPYLVVLNLGAEAIVEDYTMIVGMEYGEVMINSRQPGSPRRVAHNRVELGRLELLPAEAVVIKLY